VISLAQARAVAARLDLGLADVPCLLCLSLVADALEEGQPHGITGALLRVTPDLWHEGLDGPALAAVRRARDAGTPYAGRALADLEAGGARSRTARAIVRRLAEDLRRRARAERSLSALARDRLPLAPPELN
jgi:hypothetical protein